eukprot:2554900-Pyramimonas_sp.AAC.1
MYRDARALSGGADVAVYDSWQAGRFDHQFKSNSSAAGGVGHQLAAPSASPRGQGGFPPPV